VRDGDTFTEVPEEEIVKGYEHAKGHHVLIHPREVDELKLEAKHTIDMVRFVDEAEIDSRYFEKPYYLVPDGDDADEGYTVIRDALKQTRKIAVGQLIMHGRGHFVGIKAMDRGLVLYILRYADELREPTSYFEGITADPEPQAVKLAAELIEHQRGRFEPEKMPDQYAIAIREMIQAKVENRAPELVVATEGKPETAVVNIMAALKQSMEAKGRTKVREAVRKKMGKQPEEEAGPTPARSRPSTRVARRTTSP
jgi:DNA end-binding protein Ku